MYLCIMEALVRVYTRIGTEVGIYRYGSLASLRTSLVRSALVQLHYETVAIINTY